MRVRAKKKHLNAYGDTIIKFPGKHYDIPDAAAAPLIELGIVEQLPDDDASPADPAADTGAVGDGADEG